MKPQTILLWAWIAIVTVLVCIGVYINNDSYADEHQEDNFSYFEIAIFELVRREDLRLEKYMCPSGKPTIGVGLQTDSFNNITFQQAKDLLYIDFQNRYDVIAQLLPNHSRNQIMAVTLFAHNVGINRLQSYPQWKRILNQTSDVSEKWLEYSYYTPPNGKPRFSDNLAKARSLEVMLWENDIEGLKHMRDSLKKETTRIYEKAINDARSNMH